MDEIVWSAVINPFGLDIVDEKIVNSEEPYRDNMR